MPANAPFKQRLTTLTIVFLVIISVAGCALLGYKEPVPPRWNSPRYVPKGSYEFTDSVTLVAWLNDSIFEKSDIVTQEDTTFDWRKYQEYHNPRIYFYLKNLSDQDVLVNWYDLDRIIYQPNFSDAELGFLLGRGVESFNDVIILVNDLPVDTIFIELPSQDSLLFYDSLEIIFHYDDHVEFVPGNYWIQLIYKNYLWQDTSLPVYIGEIRSDTMWFRIRE